MIGLEEFLEKRKEENLLRILHPADRHKDGRIYFKDKEYIDFSSNDYLGLAGHPKIKEASIKAIEELGTGSSASRLLSGDLEIHHHLEEKTALFKKKESALVFNTGYQANVGIISALYTKNDAIFSDRLNHASILDGILLSGVSFFRFRHNDMNHLESLLKKERGKFRNSLVITEAIFSMDGDRAPLKDMVELKEKYNCQFMVDEAHSTGIFGKEGSGLVQEEGFTDRVDLIMGTFSKALGSFGAYLAGSKKVIEYLINTCRSFIYSTALPPSVIAANLASLELLKEEPYRRELLLENAGYLRGELKAKGFKIRGSSQIIPLVLEDNLKTVEFSEGLKSIGYWVLPIRHPTVPLGESRVRFSLSYNHNKEILHKLLEEINNV